MSSPSIAVITSLLQKILLQLKQHKSLTTVNLCKPLFGPSFMVRPTVYVYHFILECAAWYVDHDPRSHQYEYENMLLRTKVLSMHICTTWSNSLGFWYPSCLHTTVASLESHLLPHTVPHIPLIHTSTLPSLGSAPPTRRILPLPEHWGRTANIAFV